MSLKWLKWNRVFFQSLLAYWLWPSLFANPIHAATFPIDAAGKLTALSSNASFTTGTGNHYVRFSTYANVGNLSLTSLAADTLFFERNSPDTTVVKVSGKLFKFEGLTSTTVVLRGLAFHLAAGTNEKFIEGLTSGSPNHRLLIDSCIILADTLNSTFLSWLGTKAEIRRSLLVVRKSGTNVKMDFEGDTITFQNNLINFEGVIGSKTANRIALIGNTINKTQLNLSTDGATTYQFTGNFFAYPPSSNRLSVGGTQKFAMRILGDFTLAGSSAQNNLRYTSWTDFDYPPASSLFSASPNLSVLPDGGKSDTTLWDWRLASDSIHGAWNGAYPITAFNLWPSRTGFATRLNGKDSVEVDFSPAAIPRLISLGLNFSTYPALTDSTRTLWRKDTAMVLTGLASLRSVIFPQAQSLGKPMLFVAESPALAISPGPLGENSSATFVNPFASAKYFLPAYGGQNTQRGLNAAVTGTGADTSLTFSSISRTGRTTFAAPSSPSLSKRLRPMLRSGLPLGFRYQTSAEGEGTARLGLAKSGATSPFSADSLIAHDGNSLRNVSDSAGKYWVSIPFAPSGEFRVWERLAVGSGRDTVTHGSRRVMAASAKGHQLRIDTTFSLVNSKAPNLAEATKGISLSWPGRAIGDSLYLSLEKPSRSHKAFAFLNDSASAWNPFAEDTAKVTLALALGDSATPIFLAKPYPIPSGKRVKFAVGEDSVLSLLSTTPGNFSMDTSIDHAPISKDTLRLAVKRRILIENLQIQDVYSVAINAAAPGDSKRIQGFVYAAKAWSAKPVTYADGFWRVVLPSDAEGFAMGEYFSKPDTVKQDTAVALKSLRLSPRTMTLSGKGDTGSFTLEFDPVNARDSVQFSSLDAGIASVSVLGKVLALAPGKGRIRVASFKYSNIADTAFVDVGKVPLEDTTEPADTTGNSPDPAVLTAADSLPVLPSLPALNTVSNGILEITPSLFPEEKSKTKGFLVEAWVVDAEGVQKLLTDRVSTVDSSAKLALPSGVLGGYRIALMNKAGIPAWVDTFSVAPIDPTVFVKEANERAPEYRPWLWELIGYPQNVPASSLIGVVGENKISASVSEWKNGWKELDAKVILTRGRGYLLGIGEGIKPNLAIANFPILDSLVLDTGWQIVSNPLPIPLDDKDLILSSKDVSYFEELLWQGSGKNAQSSWKITETLKPFRGYAVYAAKKTTVKFPLIPLPPPAAQAKFASNKPLRLDITEVRSGARGQLLMGGQERAIAPRGQEFLDSDFKVAWNKPGGSMAMRNASGADFFVHLPFSGKIAIGAISDSPQPLAIWNWHDNRLTPIGMDTLNVKSGWNTFKLIRAETEAWADIEALLQQQAHQAWTILATRLHPAKRTLTVSLKIPESQNPISDIRLILSTISGRTVYQKAVTGVLPGKAEFALPMPEIGTGVLFLSIVDNQTRKNIAQSSVILGME